MVFLLLQLRWGWLIRISSDGLAMKYKKSLFLADSPDEKQPYPRADETCDGNAVN
jgi:hypothetical protein